MMNRHDISRLGLFLFVIAPLAAAWASGSTAGDSVKRGRYLVSITGCNDCHTEGFASSGGDVPTKDWLTGSHLGYKGPWGTTYPPNLRLFMQTKSRNEWIQFAHHAKLRPPMPNWALHDMTDADLGAIYAFIRHLGPAGKPAPEFVPPDEEPHGPVVTWPAPPGS